MSRLEDIWWRRDAARSPAALLAVLSATEALYRAGVSLRGGLYAARLARPWRAAVPVVSIGNVAVGGGGKTPAVLEVARRLLARGRRVAVLSRGYGAQRSSPRVVSDGARLLLDAREAGDEPFLLARRLPGAAVLCGARRVELARRALAELGADALVLDDGFQHRALARDLDIVAFDAADPAGNGRLLPRGPNREPFSALGRAQLAWLSRVDQADPGALARLRERVAEATGRAPVESRHAVVDILDGTLARSFGADDLRGRRTLLLCALARPEGFQATLASLGAEVVAQRSYRDHRWFTNSEIEEALAAAKAAGCDRVATTEKDAVRLPPRWASDQRWRVVTVSAEVVRGCDILDGLIGRALDGWS